MSSEYRTITRDELLEILKLHSKWLNGEADGKRANLSGADLRKADLRKADLSDSNLSDSNLEEADLSGAYLHGANLSGAYLVGVNLEEAELGDANLSGADMRNASLSNAILSWANLSQTYLRKANLHGAILRCAILNRANLDWIDLSEADLRGADLHRTTMYFANLSRANLRRANLNEACLLKAKNIPELAAAQTSILPEEGDVIGWKKLRHGLICKLRIPADAKRTNGSGRECRAEFAEVLAIYSGDKEIESGQSIYDHSFEYHVGEIVRSQEWDNDKWRECTSGIHFFLTRMEAEEYVVD